MLEYDNYIKAKKLFPFFIFEVFKDGNNNVIFINKSNRSLSSSFSI